MVVSPDWRQFTPAEYGVAVTEAAGWEAGSGAGCEAGAEPEEWDVRHPAIRLDQKS